jgi:hypothetical protein
MPCRSAVSDDLVESPALAKFPKVLKLDTFPGGTQSGDEGQQLGALARARRSASNGATAIDSRLERTEPHGACITRVRRLQIGAMN